MFNRISAISPVVVRDKGDLNFPTESVSGKNCTQQLMTTQFNRTVSIGEVQFPLVAIQMQSHPVK